MIETTNDRSPITVLVTPRYTPENLDRLAELCPEVRFVGMSQDGDVPPEGREATVLLRCFMSKPALRNALSQAPRVKWMHTCTAGFDQLLVPEIDSRDILVTRSAVTSHIPIAEWVMASILYMAKGFGDLALAQADRQWAEPDPIELEGATVLVVGAGAIGTQVAKRCQAFGMRTIGLRRQGGTGHHFDLIAPSSDLHSHLPTADFVVISCPLTSETKGLISDDEFAMMKPSAFLVNIARGAIVPETDLRHALTVGEIAGAVVDVFEEEPLPASSSLWHTPNLLITPHSSFRSPNAPERGIREFAENLERFVTGRPLLNLLKDPSFGY